MTTSQSPLFTAIRAVTASLTNVSSSGCVLVACSGGADSLALAGAVAAMSQRGDQRRFGAIVIDHQLQADSASVAAIAKQQCIELGLDPVEVLEVDVAIGPGSGGLEAAARDARRAALRQAAERHLAQAVLLGHTLDDQAETVLLGLARGSGARSLSGMSDHDELWRRPFLRVSRATVRAACSEAGLAPHEDPHNVDSAFARVRVRETALPMLESELGPGVANALARTAELLRNDADALDEWARSEYDSRVEVSGETVFVSLIPEGDDSATFAQLPTAIRTGVERLALQHVGCPIGAATFHHLSAVDALADNWRGQGATRAPGDVEVSRDSGKLCFRPAGALLLDPSTRSPQLLSKDH